MPLWMFCFLVQVFVVSFEVDDSFIIQIGGSRLNISKDTGPVLTLVVVIDDGSNWDGWYGIDTVVEGFIVSI